MVKTVKYVRIAFSENVRNKWIWFSKTEFKMDNILFFIQAKHNELLLIFNLLILYLYMCMRNSK